MSRKPIETHDLEQLYVNEGMNDCEVVRFKDIQEYISELEERLEVVDKERKMFAENYEKAILDYSDVANQLEVAVELLQEIGVGNSDDDCSCEYCRAGRFVEEALSTIKDKESL